MGSGSGGWAGLGLFDTPTKNCFSRLFNSLSSCPDSICSGSISIVGLLILDMSNSC